MASARPLRFLVHMLIVVLSVSHMGAALVLAGRYDPWWTLGLGLSLAAFLGWVAERTALRRPWSDTPAAAWHGRDLLLILGLALVLRPGPLPDFVGSRDDGVYSNMAAHMSRGGQPTHTDVTLPVPPPTDGRAYLQSVRPTGNTRVFDWVQPGYRQRLEGSYLPGVYIADASGPTYVFQFVHVHPVWMSLGAALLGVSHMGWVVILSGLLAVFLFHRLVLLLTGRRRAALAGGLLLATNPLHAVFSRGTVSEPLSLCFLLGMLTCLAAAWRAAGDDGQRRLCAALAVACFSAYGLTRIDGFFVFPFLAAAAAYALAGNCTTTERRLVVGTLIGCLGVYGLSVIYTHATSFPYAVEQYTKIFRPLLGERWREILPWLLVAALGGLAVLLRGIGRGDVVGRAFRRIRDRLAPAALALMGVVLVLHGIKIVRLALGVGADHVGYIARYDLAGHGLRSAAHSSLVNAAIYLSLPVAGLAVWQLTRWRDRSPLRTLVVLLATGFVVYGAVLQWVMPFQFYYGRYLLTGIIPSVLLLVVCGLDDPRGRRDPVWWLVGAGLAWSLVLSATQLQFRRYDDFLDGLQEAVREVAADDLVLLDQRVVNYTHYTAPLVYALDRNVWTFDNRERLDAMLGQEDLLAGYGTVWAFSKMDSLPPAFDLVREAAFEWGRADRQPVMPLTDRGERFRASLFRFDPARYARSDTIYRLREGGVSATVEGMDQKNVWSGPRLEFAFDLDDAGYEQIGFTLLDWRPAGHRDLRPGLTVTLNGRQLATPVVERRRIVARIPPGLLATRDNRLVVEVAPFVPAETIRDNQDRRALGLAIESVVLRGGARMTRRTTAP